MILHLLACFTPCGDGMLRLNDGTCVEDGNVTTAEEPVALDTPRLLRRMSLDLRGALPDVDDLDTVEADPGQLSFIRDRYLEDPRLEERLVDMFGEIWHTQVDIFQIQYYEFPEFNQQPEMENIVERAIGEEPLRLLAHIGVQDKPWTDILTVDYTLIHESIASIWPVERIDGEGWQLAWYTDGRPAAGVLSTSGLWWRYISMGTNYNRGRAAAITRLLICEDYLSRPVTFENVLSFDTENEIQTNQNCTTCHAAIDPIAANLFGFYAVDINHAGELTHYHSGRELMGPEVLDIGAAWYGTPVDGLEDLAIQIAGDDRFVSCAAETVARMLWRRELSVADVPELGALRNSFVEGDLRLRSLLAAATDTPAYRAGPSAESTENTLRLMAPTLMADTLEHFTGFRWANEGWDQMTNDTYGYRNMAGGVDGRFVSKPQIDPNFTQMLTIKRLAEAAADQAVAQGMFSTVGDTTGDLEQSIATLHWQLMATRPDEETLASHVALWQAVAALDGEDAAWSGLLSAMIRDPEFIGY